MLVPEPEPEPDPEPQPEQTSLPTHYYRPESRPHGGATGQSPVRALLKLSSSQSVRLGRTLWGRGGIYKSAPRRRKSANDGSKTSFALPHRSRGLVPVSFHGIKSKNQKVLVKILIFQPTEGHQVGSVLRFSSFTSCHHPLFIARARQYGKRNCSPLCCL